jgi:hypothetical protein
MKKLMMVVLVVMVAMVVGCGGSMKGGAKGPEIKWTTTENPHQGQPSATENQTEEQPAPVDVRENVGGLPAECKGVLPAANRLASDLLVCRCQDGDTTAVWSVHRWQAHYPYCNNPEPGQVLRHKAVKTSASVSVTSAPAPATASQTTTVATNSRTQIACETRNEGESRAAICSVAKDNQPAQTFQCLGPKVKALTAEQKLTYVGGPPCTCEGGRAPTMVAATKNTWMCD